MTQIYDASYRVRDTTIGGYLTNTQFIHVSSPATARDEIVAHELAHPRNPWWEKNVARLIEVGNVSLCEGHEDDNEEDEDEDEPEIGDGILCDYCQQHFEYTGESFQTMGDKFWCGCAEEVKGDEE